MRLSGSGCTTIAGYEECFEFVRFAQAPGQIVANGVMEGRAAGFRQGFRRREQLFPCHQEVVERFRTERFRESLPWTVEG